MTNTCLNTRCRCSKLVSRGLCANCYATASKLVRDGRTTWRKLERAGKVLPVGHFSNHGFRKTNWFLDKNWEAVRHGR